MSERPQVVIVDKALASMDRSQDLLRLMGSLQGADVEVFQALSSLRKCMTDICPAALIVNEIPENMEASYLPRPDDPYQDWVWPKINYYQLYDSLNVFFFRDALKKRVHQISKPGTRLREIIIDDDDHDREAEALRSGLKSGTIKGVVPLMSEAKLIDYVQRHMKQFLGMEKFYRNLLMLLLTDHPVHEANSKDELSFLADLESGFRTTDPSIVKSIASFRKEVMETLVFDYDVLTGEETKKLREVIDTLEEWLKSDKSY